MLPSNKDLKYMREAVKLYMPDSVSIYSVSKAFNDYGVETKTRTLLQTIKGQFSEPNGSETRMITQLLNDGVENVETIRLALPFGTTVNPNDEVDDMKGKTWNIIHVSDSYTITANTVVLLKRVDSNE